MSLSQKLHENFMEDTLMSLRTAKSTPPPLNLLLDFVNLSHQKIEYCEMPSSETLMLGSRLVSVLCLHGNNQNKDIFRQKTGSFRKPLKKFVDFEYLDAPHSLQHINLQETPSNLLNHDIGSNDICSERRGWWFKEFQEGKSDGLKESLELFEKFIDSNGPFDGMIGFSQGAAFLALACILLEDKLKSSSLKFVVLVAGFKSSIDSHKKFYHAETRVNIPSLHIVGETDKVISADRSKDLFDIFNNGQLVSHPGGHYVPATKELINKYQQFITSFLTK